MSGLQLINFTLESIGALSLGYHGTKWYFKGKRYLKKAKRAHARRIIAERGLRK